MARGFQLVAALMLGALGACGRDASPPPDACRSVGFEGQRFTLCSAIPGTHRIDLATLGPDGQPLRSFAALEAALGSEAGDVAFATNAGMYDR